MKNPCAQAFKLIRLANELTQNQFSERLDISSSYVGQIEQGKAFPSYELLCKVIEMFDVDANLFFGGGNVQTVIDNSFYKLVSDMSKNQLDGIKGLLKFVTNVSIINCEIVDDSRGKDG
jgi:transcriptional regulator with XRE-family HTH domain